MSYTPQPLYLFDSAWQAPEIHRLLDESFADWHRKSTPDGDHTLFHYTDLAGLRGILSDRSFWLTHALALNDPAEIEYGVALTSREIMRVLDAHPPDGLPQLALAQLLVEVQTAFRSHQVFVASFCEDGDLLSQWREYGARGGGYAVGITLSDRLHAGVPDADREDPNPYFRKVLYDPHEQIRLVRAFLDAFVRAVASAEHGSVLRLPQDERSVAPYWIAAHAANFIFDLVVSFKHPAFIEEQEWRLVRVLADNGRASELRFRHAQEQLVPYRPTHLYVPDGEQRGAFPLHSLRFGPTVDAKRTQAALSLLVAYEAAQPHQISIATYVPVQGAAAALR